ncbi:RNA-binding protein 25 [Amyelois transitella]|uniref:RNA-binding protein 25 n=1 Tax=Amyelois transitella TaxID=680683 RepID=UPI00298F5263|nr:RNA-binding protein 25 [Amyelois transitella]XP_060808263.1 RNA-binding protein 25 [Amyelois transitella]
MLLASKLILFCFTVALNNEGADATSENENEFNFYGYVDKNKLRKLVEFINESERTNVYNEAAVVNLFDGIDVRNPDELKVAMKHVQKNFDYKEMADLMDNTQTRIHVIENPEVLNDFLEEIDRKDWSANTPSGRRKTLRRYGEYRDGKHRFGKRMSDEANDNWGKSMKRQKSSDRSYYGKKSREHDFDRNKKRYDRINRYDSRGKDTFDSREKFDNKQKYGRAKDIDTRERNDVRNKYNSDKKYYGREKFESRSRYDEKIYDTRNKVNDRNKYDEKKKFYDRNKFDERNKFNERPKFYESNKLNERNKFDERSKLDDKKFETSNKLNNKYKKTDSRENDRHKTAFRSKQKSNKWNSNEEVENKDGYFGDDFKKSIITLNLDRSSEKNGKPHTNERINENFYVSKTTRRDWTEGENKKRTEKTDYIKVKPKVISWDVATDKKRAKKVEIEDFAALPSKSKAEFGAVDSTTRKQSDDWETPAVNYENKYKNKMEKLYESKYIPKRRPVNRNGGFSFGRTPIPFVGKKILYADN